LLAMSFTMLDGGADITPMGDSVTFNSGSVADFDAADMATVFTDIEEINFTGVTYAGGDSDFDITGDDIKNLLGGTTNGANDTLVINDGSVTVSVTMAAGMTDNGSGRFTYNDGTNDFFLQINDT